MTTRKKPAPRRKPAVAAAKPTPAPVNKPAPAKPATAKQPPKDKGKKTKTVRDSFNMPEHDYALIGLLKKRALAAALEIKKSELLRAGLKVLSRMPEKEFLAALATVDPVKTGRPKKKK